MTIIDVDINDFGSYKCLAKNSLGEGTDGAIKLYRKYCINYDNLYLNLASRIVCCLMLNLESRNKAEKCIEKNKWIYWEIWKTYSERKNKWKEATINIMIAYHVYEMETFEEHVNMFV